MTDLTVLVVDTPTLGDRSYLVHDGEVAFVVDPQRDIDRVLTLLDEHGVRLTARLRDPHPQRLRHRRPRARAAHRRAVPRQRRGRRLLRPHPRRGRQTSSRWVDGCASLRWRPPATRSPTSPTSSTTPSRRGRPRRPARRRLLRRLAALRRDRPPGPARSRAHPRPGAPPARLGPPARRPAARRGRGLPDPRLRLVLLRHPVRRHVVDHRPGEADQPGAHPGRADLRRRAAGRARRRGRRTTPTWPRPTRPARPSPTCLPPAVADATELRRRIEAGEWVVDLRHRTAFAAGHAPGTLNFGLDGGFATYLGWLVTWGTPITLLGETAQDVAEAQRELVRIGIDRPAAHATGGPEDWSDREPSSFPTATFADLAQVRHHREVVVLDVRRADEHDAARIDGAVNIPLHELRDRLAEVPAGEVWVHCAGGYRASVAASVLDAAGSHPRSPSTTPSTTPSRSACTSWGLDGVIELLLAVVAGALIGLSLGALGGGGSILAVPVLSTRSARAPRRRPPGRWWSSA